MAIYIVDQFSLNTDLPLDNRYVANTYDDVSLYHYPGMQVYQTSDQTIWYADNNLDWHPISEGIDASIDMLFNYFIDLSTFTYEQITQLDASILRIDTSLNDIYIRLDAADASIIDLRDWNLAQDASIIDLRSDLDDVSTRVNAIEDWQPVIDASIIALGSDIDDVSTRVDDLETWSTIVDTSIIALGSDIDDVSVRVATNETSIGWLTDWQEAQDVSIMDLYDRADDADASLNHLYDWNEAQDASLDEIRQDVEASLGLYVLKAGDTMTGPLVLQAGLDVTGDTSIFGGLYVDSDAAIKGNLTINGSLYIVDVGTLDVSTGYVRLNTGLTGTPPSTLQSGVVVERGDQDPYVFVYDETDQTFRIGIATFDGTNYDDASTQAVATREDAPVPDGIAVWNDTENRFDTYNELTFDANGLTLNASLFLPEYGSGANDLILVVQPDGTVKAVATADASIASLYEYVDGSLATQDASIDELRDFAIDLSTHVDAIQDWVDVADASIDLLQDFTLDLSTRIDSLEECCDAVDASIVDLRNDLDDVSTRVEAIEDWQPIVDASIIALGSDIDDVSTRVEAIEDWQPVVDASIIALGSDIDDVSTRVDELETWSEIVDASIEYMDSSINQLFDLAAIEASLYGLTDVSIIEPLGDKQIIQYSEADEKWINTNNLFWDKTLPTTSDDVGGIEPGSDLEGKTLKEILELILYEYQVPVINESGTYADPIGGVYEKGVNATDFGSIDIYYSANNSNYPMAGLTTIEIERNGSPLYDDTVAPTNDITDVYTDNNPPQWGGSERPLVYTLFVIDENNNNGEVVSYDLASFSFFYRQYWGIVDGDTDTGDIDSNMITNLSDSRIEGNVDFRATFENPGTGYIKYLFAYPDTIASPDNFDELDKILDQNGFDLRDSFETGHVNVQNDEGGIRYRYYLLKNRVTTETFDIKFKFKEI